MADEGPDCRYCPYIECCSNQCGLAPERGHSSSIDDVVDEPKKETNQSWKYHLADKGGNLALFAAYTGVLLACGYYGVTRYEAIQKDPSKGLFFYESLGGIFLGGMVACMYLMGRLDDLKESFRK